MAGGGGAAAGGTPAVGERVGEEDSAGRGMGGEGGAAGKTAEAPCRTIEAGGETVTAGSAGDAVEEVDGAAGGGVDRTGVPSGVLRGGGLGSFARDGVEVEGREGLEEGNRRLSQRYASGCVYYLRYTDVAERSLNGRKHVESKGISVRDLRDHQ